MSATLTVGATSIDVALLLEYTAPRDSATIVHPVIGRPDPDVTIRPLRTRTGRIVMFCLTYEDAADLVELHASGLPVSYSDTEEAGRAMTYVVPLGSSVALEPAPQDSRPYRWTVSLDYAEVTP